MYIRSENITGVLLPSTSNMVFKILLLAFINFFIKIFFKDFMYLKVIAREREREKDLHSYSSLPRQPL